MKNTHAIAVFAALVSLVAAIFSAGLPARIAGLHYKIIIIAGQSNAVGRAPVLPEWRVNSSGIEQVGRFGDTNLAVIPAIEPLAHWDASGAAFGLKSVSLLRGVEGGEFLIIPAAMGASGFVDHMWTAKTGPLYVDLVQRTRSILNRYPGSSIRAVLWHQGETEWEESTDGYNVLFPQQMAEMVEALREDLPIANTPFIMGGAVPAWADRQTPNANAVLEEIADDIGACFVTSEDLIPMEDGIHFELGSQIRLGQRYFDAMQTC